MKHAQIEWIGILTWKPKIIDILQVYHAHSNTNLFNYYPFSITMEMEQSLYRLFYYCTSESCVRAAFFDSAK
jgi:hypothetical protein